MSERKVLGWRVRETSMKPDADYVVPCQSPNGWAWQSSKPATMSRLEAVALLRKARRFCQEWRCETVASGLRLVRVVRCRKGGDA